MTHEDEPQPNGAPARDNVWRMFDRIAPRYDLLNHALSLRRDVAWRKRLLRHLPVGDSLRVLDLATGTADVLLTLARGSTRVRHGVGIDMAGGMLTLGLHKVREQGLEGRIALVRGDAIRACVSDGAFDAATIAFGIRNVLDVGAALGEMHRVLRPGGVALILEFSLPENPLMQRLYLLYFRHVLPRVGSVVSGDGSAYRYLNRTVETFPYGEAFCRCMRDAGFQDVTAYPLTFGIATLYVGTR